MSAVVHKLNRNGKVRTTYQSRIEWIPVARTELPPGAQRKYDDAWATKIAADFDPDKLGKPLIAAIPGRGGQERFWIIDGQHRIAAVKKALGEDQSVECEVIRGITIDRVAEIFRGRNTTRPVSALDKFMAGVTAKNEECVAINNAVTGLGLRIAGTGDPGTISAVIALGKIQRLDKSMPRGALLRRVLSLALECWGRAPESFNGHILTGLALVLDRHRDEIEMDVFDKKLKSCPGGALGLVGRARKLKEALGRDMNNCMARAIVSFYNAGRSKNRLPEWGERA